MPDPDGASPELAKARDRGDFDGLDGGSVPYHEATPDEIREAQNSEFAAVRCQVPEPKPFVAGDTDAEARSLARELLWCAIGAAVVVGIAVAAHFGAFR